MYTKGHIKWHNEDVMRSIKGTDIIHIKMHDGMGRKLDCWYVPDLRKNPISFDTLSKDGMKYFGERDWLTFSKDALVFMRAKLQHGIYFMEGCTTRGTMAISQSLNQDNDKK